MYVIVKQPNEKYAVWSTVTDRFVNFNLTPHDLYSMINTRDNMLEALGPVETEDIFNRDHYLIFFETYIDHTIMRDKIEEADKEGVWGWTFRLEKSSYSDKTLRAILAIGNKRE